MEFKTDVVKKLVSIPLLHFYNQVLQQWVVLSSHFTLPVCIEYWNYIGNAENDVAGHKSV